jgi:hypothetical protein
MLASLWRRNVPGSEAISVPVRRLSSRSSAVPLRRSKQMSVIWSLSAAFFSASRQLIQRVHVFF